MWITAVIVLAFVLALVAVFIIAWRLSPPHRDWYGKHRNGP